MEQHTLLSTLPPLVAVEFLYQFRNTVHLQSWTRCEESDAMWRIYSYNNRAVRIATTTKKIESIGKISYLDVDYKTLGLEEELKRIFIGNLFEMKNVFSSKREAFSHEQEVRLITDLDFDYLPDKYNISGEEATEIHKQVISQLHQSGQITEAEMKEAVSQINAEQFKQKTQLRSTKHISFAHVENFIESAMVHPLAPDWYIETVRTFCELNKVSFLGKSPLYTFNPN